MLGVLKQDALTRVLETKYKQGGNSKWHPACFIFIEQKHREQTKST